MGHLMLGCAFGGLVALAALALGASLLAALGLYAAAGTGGTFATALPCLLCRAWRTLQAPTPA